MSQIENNCKNYTKFERIGAGSYGNIYKAQDKRTKSYVAIKEIDKVRYNQLTKEIFNEAEIMNIIKCENSVNFKDKIDSKDYFCIIMDLCITNLEDYIMSRENTITINEIKEVLIQLINVFIIII